MHVVDRGLTEIYHIREERGKMPTLRKNDYNNVAAVTLSTLTTLSYCFNTTKAALANSFI